MKNSKNKRIIILSVILLGLLVVAYKVIFLPPTDDSLSVDANTNSDASEKVLAILKDVESINFDTNIITDPRFKSLQSIEIPLPSLPVGKKNPFSTAAN